MLKKLLALVIGAAVVYTVVEANARAQQARPVKAPAKNRRAVTLIYPQGFHSLAKWHSDVRH